MNGLSTNIAITNTDGHILLILREDFEIWCMPGGGVEPGETAPQGAIREAKEETGIDVSLTRLVGLYTTPNWTAGNTHIILFAAEPIGGTLTPQPGESLEARYFPPDALPDNLAWTHRHRIQDAISGIGGSTAVMQDMRWQPGGKCPSWAEIHTLRDQSGLSRQEFARRYLGDSGDERIEIEGTRDL